MCLCVCSVPKLCPTLWPHGLQHSRLPCPSLSPTVCPNSCPLSQWCHPTVSISISTFSLATKNHGSQSHYSEISPVFSLSPLKWCRPEEKLQKRKKKSIYIYTHIYNVFNLNAIALRQLLVESQEFYIIWYTRNRHDHKKHLDHKAFIFNKGYIFTGAHKMC